jgi:hypothetical protein
MKIHEVKTCMTGIASSKYRKILMKKKIYTENDGGGRAKSHHHRTQSLKKPQEVSLV